MITSKELIKDIRLFLRTFPLNEEKEEWWDTPKQLHEDCLDSFLMWKENTEKEEKEKENG